MSFVPITRWVLRCDGDTTRGRCTEHLLACDPDEADDDHALTVWAPAVFDRPELDRHDRDNLRWAGWLALRDGRVLCRAHVTGLEHLAHAAVDGLPFDEAMREFPTTGDGPR